MGRRTSYNDIALNLVTKLFKTEDLHYGYWLEHEKPTLSGLPAAQTRYVDVLLSHFPDDAKKVLDVGSGTGSIAKRLLDQGREVVCVCPDSHLNEHSSKKTNGRIKLVHDYFETAKIDECFDLVLMAESCQYIKTDKGVPKAWSLLRPGGYYLVCDFFKKAPISSREYSRSGHLLGKFLTQCNEQGFELVVDKDITRAVSPTMDLYQGVISDYVLPVMDGLSEMAHRRFPRIYKIVTLLYGKELLRLRRKYSNQGAEIFEALKSYRILLFQRPNSNSK